MFERLEHLFDLHRDEMTTSDAIVFACEGASTRHRLRMEELRDAARRAAARRDDPRSRPDAVVEAGSVLTSQERARVETVVRRVIDELVERIEVTLSETEADKAPSLPIRPPVEWGGVALMMLLGPNDTQRLISEQLSHLEDLGPAGAEYGMAYLSFETSRLAPGVLEAALIPAAVTEFERLIESLLRVGLMLYPDALGVGQKSFTVNEVKAVGGGAGLQLAAIEKVVGAYLREGVTAWAARLTKWPGIDLHDLVDEWAAFVEVFARRNAIVHASGYADQSYRSAVAELMEPPPIGASLSPDVAYTLRAVDHLEVVGLAIAALWPSRLGVPPRSPGGAPGSVYRALELGRWSHARSLADVLLAMDWEDTDTVEILRVNRWLAIREEQGSVNAIEDELAAWSPTESDWQWDFARAALRLHPHEAEAALNSAVSRGVSVRSLRRWPLFKLLQKQFPYLASDVHSRPIQPRPRRRKRH